jgi:hypothetical protein
MSRSNSPACGQRLKDLSLPLGFRVIFTRLTPSRSLRSLSLEADTWDSHGEPEEGDSQVKKRFIACTQSDDAVALGLEDAQEY